MQQQHCLDACIYSFFTMLKLVLIRHSESTWDLENRLSGRRRGGKQGSGSGCWPGKTV